MKSIHPIITLLCLVLMQGSGSGQAKEDNVPGLANAPGLVPIPVGDRRDRRGCGSEEDSVEFCACPFGSSSSGEGEGGGGGKRVGQCGGDGQEGESECHGEKSGGGGAEHGQKSIDRPSPWDVIFGVLFE